MIMERTEVLDLMGELKLFGMRSAYDETLATALKRKHEPQRFVGDLLKAEISEKQARSIKYQLTIAKLPLAKDVDDFTFTETPINEGLVRDLVGGNFIASRRNVVLVGGTGTGPPRVILAIWAISFKPTRSSRGMAPSVKVIHTFCERFSQGCQTCSCQFAGSPCCFHDCFRQTLCGVVDVSVHLGRVCLTFRAGWANEVATSGRVAIFPVCHL